VLKSLKNTISGNLMNIPGWRTNRKIVVIESDDWGSIRMPSKKAYDELYNIGIPVNKSPYCRFDAIETGEDFYQLFDVLKKFRDKNGICPVITTNTVVANPDFKRIKESGYTKYYYEPFTSTYKRYKYCQDSWQAFKTGINKGFLKPQLHGREHVNVNYWLSLLQSNNEIFLKCFSLHLWGLSNDVIPTKTPLIQATFDIDKRDNLDFLEQSIKEGQEIFKSHFGFISKSFIPNNFIFPLELMPALKKNGIDILQGMKYLLLPKYNSNYRSKIRRYQGQLNQFRILDLIRNCSFEPSVLGGSVDKSIKQCMTQIDNAFFWKKPAIISMHRLNFMGSFSKANRKNNLQGLETLLTQITNKYDSVEFMSSDKLGELIYTN